MTYAFGAMPWLQDGFTWALHADTCCLKTDISRPYRRYSNYLLHKRKSDDGFRPPNDAAHYFCRTAFGLSRSDFSAPERLAAPPRYYSEYFR